VADSASNAPTTPGPATATRDTLVPLLAEIAGRGERQAIQALADEGSEDWSYAELGEAVGRLAGGLARAGIEPGARVGLMAPLSPATVAGALAILHRGAAVVPIDVQFGDATLAHVVEDSGVTVVLTTAGEADRLGATPRAPRTILLDGDADDERHWRRVAEAAPAAPHEAAPDDVAALFYTSGTTGRPKGVPLTHENLAFQIRTLLAAELVSPGDRVLLPLPIHHVYPFVIGMLVPLAIGLPLVLPRSLTGPEVVRALQEGKVTLVVGVPRLYAALDDAVRRGFEERGAVAGAVFRALLAAAGAIRGTTGLRAGRLLLAPVHRKIGPDVRVLASGGSPLDRDLARRLDAFGWDVAIGYGLTETSPLLTILLPGEGHLDTVGRPVPGVELRVVPRGRPADDEDERGATRVHGVPDGATVGEVTVRGPNVFGGYHHLPQATREVLDDGWFRTGDLGWIDDDGYLHLVGRASTMIVTEGGENVQPEEIEDAYAAEPAIREIGVLEKDRRLVAVVVPDVSKLRGAVDETTALRQRVESVSRRLPSYQRITDFVVSPEALARTRLGKIQRHTLAERYETIRRSGPGPSGPMAVADMSDHDQALVEEPAARRVWNHLARRHAGRRLTPDTSLQLELGIDSLAWLDLTLEIARDTGVELDEATIGGLETVRDLLAAVAARSGARAGSTRRDVLEEPEAALGDEQRRWLAPLGPVQSALARVAWLVNLTVMKALFRVRAHGRERLPADGPTVLAPNHASYLDPFALAAVLDWPRLRRTHWAGWTGAAFHNPLFRFVSRLAGAVPIDPERGVLSSLAFAAAALKNDRGLVWFPEGERSPAGELLPFKTGIGTVLARWPVPVVPVWIEGAFEALPRGKAWPRLRRVEVFFGEPVDPRPIAERADPSDAPAAIAAALRDAVAELERRHRKR
jgi:long-chain acyl-CoA synthetase